VAKLPFTVERTYSTVLTIRFDNASSGWERWLLLRTDAHHDNRFCNQKMERKHLEQAKDRDACILDAGDLFCAMQGKWDKRADQAQLIPELRGPATSYSDELVRYCADFYEPFALNWGMLSPGNHESEFRRRNETNLTERLAERLKVKGSPVQVGTYRGWVRLALRINSTKQTTKMIAYEHGYGGGARVTKGLIQMNRKSAVVADADILWAGHNHAQNITRVVREKLCVRGRPVRQDVYFVRTPGYKDETSCGEGWLVERAGGDPTPLGAAWLRLFWEDAEVRIEMRDAL
jgi:hypothetical protein